MTLFPSWKRSFIHSQLKRITGYIRRSSFYKGVCGNSLVFPEGIHYTDRFPEKDCIALIPHITGISDQAIIASRQKGGKFQPSFPDPLLDLYFRLYQGCRFIEQLHISHFTEWNGDTCRIGHAKLQPKQLACQIDLFICLHVNTLPEIVRRQ